MADLDLVERYFGAWDAHDPEGVQQLFAPDGTFEDPLSGGPVTGPAIAENAAGLFTGFPDVAFEIVSLASSGPTTAVAEYVMRGTNTGATPLGPATGTAGSLAGVDLFTLTDDGTALRRVRGYWDLGGFLESLGMATHVSPASVPGLLDFGLGIRVTTGIAGNPGAFTVTWIDADGDDFWRVNALVEQMVQELMAHPGYLGSVFTQAGGRAYTFTAWSSVDDIKALRTTVHAEAMREYLAGDLGTNLMTSIWVPHKLHGTWVSDGDAKPTKELETASQWL